MLTPTLPPLVAGPVETLKDQLQELLGRYDPLAVAQLLQAEFNALPSDARDGYRCEVRLLSPSYQTGGYDL
jgi:hypothetical protein